MSLSPFLINNGECLEFPKIRDFFIEYLRIQLEKQGASNPISQACFLAGVDDCTYRRRKLASLHYKRAFCTQSDEKKLFAKFQQALFTRSAKMMSYELLVELQTLLSR